MNKEYPCTIVADLHCHTVASTHAYSTVTELAGAAAERGLIAVGCTDHGIGISDSPHIWHFHNLDVLPDVIAGVRVLRGVEANVVGFDGQLDMEGSLAMLELVVASMHGAVMPSGSVEQCTAAWLGVAQNPYVDIIGHSGTPEFTYDYETVIPEFGRMGKAVEINEHSFVGRVSSVPNCRRIAELCKKYGVCIAVDSDAHYHASVGLMSHVMDMLREIDFPPELIINGSRENMNRFFAKKQLRF